MMKNTSWESAKNETPQRGPSGSLKIQSFLSEEKRAFLKSLPSLPSREKEGHKGTYGLSVLLGGSYGMSGSITLSGRAALTGGAGLVRLMIPDIILSLAASSCSELMTSPLPSDRKGRIAWDAYPSIINGLKRAAAVGIGPGLGDSCGLEVLISRLFQEVSLPMVVDADALNALAAREYFLPLSERKIFTDGPLLPPSGPRILTPHPGEFSRLTQKKISADPKERKDAAWEFIQNAFRLYGDSQSIILVLKGAGTVITDGQSVRINETGNPGMGTAGSGDVLTGLITALLSQKISPFNAAVLGVALHGLAGDLAAAELGMESLTASVLICYLPQAFAVYRHCQGEDVSLD